MYFCSRTKADGWMLIPKAIQPLSPCNRPWVSLPPSLEGVARIKCESRSHPSPQDVINLPLQRLFSSGFWLLCLGFSFIIYCVSEQRYRAAGSSACRGGWDGGWFSREGGSCSVRFGLNSQFEKPLIFSENWQNNL